MLKKQISPDLLKQATIKREPDDTNEDFIAKAVWLRTELQQINLLGWSEHTCDWDLGLWVKLKDGSQVNSVQGYAEFEMGILTDKEFKAVDIKEFVIGLEEKVNAIGLEEDADEDSEDEDLTKLVVKLDNIIEMGLFS